MVAIGHISVTFLWTTKKNPHLFLLLLVTSSLICHIPEYGLSSLFAVIDFVEFCTPNLQNMRKPMGQDPGYSVVELGNPVFQICVTLKVQPINLKIYIKPLDP